MPSKNPICTCYDSKSEFPFLSSQMYSWTPFTFIPWTFPHGNVIPITLDEGLIERGKMNVAAAMSFTKGSIPSQYADSFCF